MKENKKRITVWFIIFLIFTGLSIYGIKLFNDGYGKYGEYKKILNPIALEFNTLPDIIKMTDIDAKVNKDKLIVTYITGEKKKEKFEFIYESNNGINYITNTDKDGRSMWNLIAVSMINAVYHFYNGTGSVLERYDLATFKQTTLEQGVVYNDVNKTVSINLNTNILDNIDGKFPSLKDDKYIKEEDLTDLVNTLKTDKKYKIQIDDINMYITDDTTKYEIYVALTEDNVKRAYKSIGSAIKLLDPELYKHLLDENGNISFNESSSKYSTTSNATFSEANIFNIDDSIFNVTLYKNKK